MSFIRPEVSRLLLRWREALSGACFAGLGLWWALGTHGPVAWIGWICMAAGTGIVLAGVQRGRFRLPGQGPGIVQVTEGQISYFGPLTGGAVALSEITRIALDPSGHPAHWVLSQHAQPDLSIPITAEGSEVLFDAFASLPGMRTEYMLGQMKRTSGAPSVVWSRGENAALRLARQKH